MVFTIEGLGVFAMQCVRLPAVLIVPCRKDVRQYFSKNKNGTLGRKERAAKLQSRSFALGRRSFALGRRERACGGACGPATLTKGGPGNMLIIWEAVIIF